MLLQMTAAEKKAQQEKWFGIEMIVGHVPHNDRCGAARNRLPAGSSIAENGEPSEPPMDRLGLGRMLIRPGPLCVGDA